MFCRTHEILRFSDEHEHLFAHSRTSFQSLVHPVVLVRLNNAAHLFLAKARVHAFTFSNLGVSPSGQLLHTCYTPVHVVGARLVSGASSPATELCYCSILHVLCGGSKKRRHYVSTCVAPEMPSARARVTVALKQNALRQIREAAPAAPAAETAAPSSHRAHHQCVRWNVNPNIFFVCLHAKLQRFPQSSPTNRTFEHAYMHTLWHVVNIRVWLCAETCGHAFNDGKKRKTKRKAWVGNVRLPFCLVTIGIKVNVYE